MPRFSEAVGEGGLTGAPTATLLVLATKERAAAVAAAGVCNDMKPLL